VSVLDTRTPLCRGHCATHYQMQVLGYRAVRGAGGAATGNRCGKLNKLQPGVAYSQSGGASRRSCPHILKTRALPRDRADGATVRVVTTLNGAPNHGWWLVLVVFLFKGIPIAT